MRDQIQEALKYSKADYTEIRIEEKETTQVAFRGKDLETANSNIDKGGVVRCIIRDKGWGVAKFNNLGDLLTKVDQAFPVHSRIRWGLRSRSRMARSWGVLKTYPLPGMSMICLKMSARSVMKRSR